MNDHEYISYIIKDSVILKVFQYHRHEIDKFNSKEPNGQIRNDLKKTTSFVLGKTAEYFLKKWLQENLPSSNIKINIMDENNKFEICDGTIDDYTYELRTSFIAKKFKDRWHELHHIGYYTTEYKTKENKKNFYFQFLWKDDRASLEQKINSIINNNQSHNDIELKFVSFLPLRMLEEKGKFSNLGQGSANYLIVKIKDCFSPQNFLTYYNKLNKNKILTIK